MKMGKIKTEVLPSRRSQRQKTLKNYFENKKIDAGKDWRDQCKGIHKVHYAMRNNIMTDVTFLVGSESKSFSAHRLILALASPVFEAMFYGPLAEESEIITLPEDDPEEFGHFLEFVYSEKVDENWSLHKTEIVADKYCVPHFREKCKDFLCSMVLNPTSVWKCLENCLFLNIEFVKEMCFIHLSSNHEVIFELGETFLNVSANIVEAIISEDNLRVPEACLLKNAIRWARHNGKNDEERKSLLVPLLRHIRFTRMSTVIFNKCLEQKELKEALGEADSLAILRHTVLPNTCKLPEWCSSKQARSDGYGDTDYYDDDDSE